MNDGFGAGVTVGLMLALAAAMFCGLCCNPRDAGYRQGQIDAANGKQHYHLTTQPDHSQTWVSDGKDGR